MVSELSCQMILKGMLELGQSTVAPLQRCSSMTSGMSPLGCTARARQLGDSRSQPLTSNSSRSGDWASSLQMWRHGKEMGQWLD